MTVAAVEPTAVRKGLSLGPWLFGRELDLAVFAGSAALALALVAIGRWLGLSPGGLPEWGWLGLVVAIDVAHVWSTVFRTYFDGDELRRHKLRYLGVPLAAYALGVGLYLHGSLTFWRVLAYAALFHFVRQQVGWVAVYRARSGQTGRFDRWLDDAVVYAATLYPVLHWHAHLASTRFAWFVPGRFRGSLGRCRDGAARGARQLGRAPGRVRGAPDRARGADGRAQAGKSTLPGPDLCGCTDLQNDSTPITAPNCSGFNGVSLSMRLVGTPSGGSCSATGGQVTGSATPTEAITFCCL